MSAPPLDSAALAIFQGFLAQTKEHAVICLDPEGMVIGWAGGAELIFGYTPREAIGQPISRLFTSEDRAKGLDRLELEVARNDSRSEDDRWHLRKDGTRIWVTGSVNAIRNAAGEVVGYVKMARDRTDLRTWGTALENELDQLRGAHQRTLAFLRTLGHEMRNPMAPLQNSAFILQRLHPDDKTGKVVEIIQAQVDTLRRLAEDLMEVSRLQGGKVGLALVPADLRELVLRAANGLQDDARAKRIRMQTILPQGALPVRIDAERFQQVLLNLLGNAIKYTPEGGSIWVKPTQEADEVVLRVEDTGIGIEPAMLTHIFELFSREASAQGMDPAGLGIGLSVVREIVQLHGGTVQARSPGSGKGSEFTVRLPADRAEAEAEQADLQAPPP